MVIFKFAFALIGGLACALAFWLQYMNRKAASWPAADGVIIKSELEDSASDGDSSVRITYRYTVNGRDFESSQFSFTAVGNDLPAKKRRVVQYPVGHTHKSIMTHKNQLRRFWSVETRCSGWGY
jgi:hypothetical protein